MGCEKLDNGLTELVASDEWCVRAALTARFHKHTECECTRTRVRMCERACARACVQDSIFHPLVQGLFVHAARTARAGLNKLVMDTHTYEPAHGAYLYTCPSWGLARGLKNALQSGSIKIGLFNILDTALMHAHTLAGVQR